MKVYKSYWNLEIHANIFNSILQVYDIVNNISIRLFIEIGHIKRHVA